MHAREEQPPLLVREHVRRRVVELVELLAERLRDVIEGLQYVWDIVTMYHLLTNISDTVTTC